jgi:hypothetical protein
LFIDSNIKESIKIINEGEGIYYLGADKKIFLKFEEIEEVNSIGLTIIKYKMLFINDKKELEKKFSYNIRFGTNSKFVLLFKLFGIKVMTKVVIYTDFDGTVTSRVGSKVVFSPFYQSLLIGYEKGETQDYKNTQMKSVEVSINIVTRNRAEYIKALFKYQGFSDIEINKLNIMQSGYKLQDVDKDLKARIQQNQRPSFLYILDDDSITDYPDMIAAAKMNFYTEEQIKGFTKEPGQFDWNSYLQEVRVDILRPDIPQ